MIRERDDVRGSSEAKLKGESCPYWQGEYTWIMYRDGTVRITIRVRKYLWKDLVYDACYVLYGVYTIIDMLSRRYFKRPISTIFFRTHTAVSRFFVSADVVYKNSVLVFLLIMFGIGGLLYTVSIPIILFLAATGRMQ